jgi:hypothetical protein
VLDVERSDCILVLALEPGPYITGMSACDFNIAEVKFPLLTAAASLNVD